MDLALGVSVTDGATPSSLFCIKLKLFHLQVHEKVQSAVTVKLLYGLTLIHSNVGFLAPNVQTDVISTPS